MPHPGGLCGSMDTACPVLQSCSASAATGSMLYTCTQTDSGAVGQWSSVCRKFGQAVQGALLGCEYLDLQSSGSHNFSCIDSQLLLQWAPRVRCLHLSEWPIKKRGMKQFVAAAVNLTEVVMNVDDVNDTACADSILCASKSVLSLRSDADEFNCYMPQELPQQLQQLEVLCMGVLLRKQSRAILQQRFEAFLGMVSGLRHLRIFSIHCASLALKCSMSLPRLASLSLRLWICHGTSLDLSWLHSQNHDQLHICLELQRCTAEASQQCLLQLEKFHISQLRLVVVEYPRRLSRSGKHLAAVIYLICSSVGENPLMQCMHWPCASGSS